MNKVALKPRLSEKVYSQSEALNTYVFDVAKNVNKHDVAIAVSRQYGVSVDSVRTAAVAGKSQRSVRRRGRSVKNFKKSDIRKAYVTLKKGHTLPIFAAVEDASDKKAAKENK